MTHTARLRILSAALLLCAASTARGHEPGEDNELPDGGTVHEFRVTTINSFTVAQQLTQPAVCGNPNVCLHNEIHLPMVINFQTGEIAIDATAPEDENETPVPPGGPGGILFNTQSGPAELVLAPPCENPDGCVGGTSIYLGTIDELGNIRFPSIGMNFELFGVSPIAMFDAPMGTGMSTDNSDPGVIAQGVPLDFATGAVTLRGVQLVPSPIIGNALQLNTIAGTIFPVPVPPIATRTLLKCQKALGKAGASFAKRKLQSLRGCVDGLRECKVRSESGESVPASCVSEAGQACNDALAKIDKARQVMESKLGKSCEGVGGGNLLARNQGLNFALNVPQCEAYAFDASSAAGLIDCAERHLECGTEQILAFLGPRAAEVLSENGFAAFVDPAGCLPLFPDGDASGTTAKDLLHCQATIGKEGVKYVGKKQQQLQKCVDAFVRCQTQQRLDDLNGADLARCEAKAQKKCDAAVAKIDGAAAKRDTKISKACADLDTANIPDLGQGLGFSNLAEHCQGLDPPVALSDLSDLLACVGASLDCASEEIVRRLEPQVGVAVGTVSAGGSALLDRYPCLVGACGDGIVDEDEECDPLFPTDNGCKADCTKVVCGDGVTEGDEECDDGNTASGDGCSSTCVIEPSACGNSIIEPSGNEVCDDGDSHGGDGCSADCQSNETCGNGVVDTLVGETCDDGGTNDGDGCSADCRSDETCGNGVIDAITGEACDDGNTAGGDGCDATCAFEACSYFSSGGPLGSRDFSIDPSTGGLFVSIVGNVTPVGTIGFTSGPMTLTASATDASGTATVTLAGDVIVGMPNLGGFTQCLKFEAVGTTGSLHCCGGHAVGMSFTRDSNKGGVGGNGPAVVLSGIGGGGIGDLQIAFQVREGSAPQATPSDCLTAAYGGASTRIWTTGEATARVLRPEQGGASIEFSTTGQAFDCSMWTTENDLGRIANADTALNAIPGVDAGNVRVFDDQSGD